MPATRPRARASLLIPAILALLLLAPEPARAEWLPNGNDIGFPFESHFGPAFVSDGSGGLYYSRGAGYYAPPRLTRILADGTVAPGWRHDDWSGSGIALFSYPWWGYGLFAFEDGAGGVIVVDLAVRCPKTCGGDPRQLLAAHLTAEGTLAPGWNPEGVLLGSTGDIKVKPHVAAAADGHAGAIVAWTTLPSGLDPGSTPGWFGMRELHSRRVDANGRPAWGDAPGLMIRSATPVPSFSEVVVADGAGGAFIYWLDPRAPGVYGQHVSPEGVLSWPIDGAAVPVANSANVSGLQATPDGSHGAMLGWVGGAGDGAELFVARVDARGAPAWPGARRRVAGRELRGGFELIAAPGGGAFVCWTVALGDSGHAIRAQRFNHGGQAMWGPDGVLVCGAPGRKEYVAMSSDEGGGVYLAWSDSREEGAVFATHLDRSGTPVRGWARDGSPVCARIAPVLAVDLATDRRGGAYVSWIDTRTNPQPYYGYAKPVRLLSRLESGGPVVAPVSVSVGTDRSRSAAPLSSRPGPAASIVGAPTIEVAGTEPILRFRLEGGLPATLELFDVAGRRAWSRDVGMLGGGRHEARFDEWARLPDGVYLVRLSEGGRTAVARTAIVR